MSLVTIHEQFRSSVPDRRLEWLNAPREWRVDTGAGRLVVVPDSPTDFWQQTHYGFSADSGHLLAAALPGDFLVRTSVRLEPVHQYDQAGLMIYYSPQCWIKASVEYEGKGMGNLGAVVTNRGRSDWSIQNYAARPWEYSLQVRKTNVDILVEYAPTDEGPWNLIRMAYVDPPECTIPRAGLYACAPKGRGAKAEFLSLHIEPL